MLRREVRFCLSVLLLLFCFTASASAEPQVSSEKYGRLSDGRAYRIDAQGYRLVDHMAELEVTVEDLKKQNDALENEIKQLRGHGAVLKSGKVQEADILGGKTRRMEPAAEFRPSIGACSWYTEPLNKRISVLEDELKAESAERQKLEAHILSWSSKAGESEDLLKNRQTALEDSLRLLAERDAELLQRREREEELKRQVLHLSKRVESLEHGSTQSKGRGPLARMSTPAPTAQQPTSPRADKAQVLQLRSQLAGKLKNIDKLIGERKTLIDQLKQRQKGIDIKIQPLVAKTGASLDSLRQRTQAVSELDEGLSLGGQIAEIEGKLRDDIRVLERLTK